MANVYRLLIDNNLLSKIEMFKEVIYDESINQQFAWATIKMVNSYRSQVNQVDQ